MSNTGHVITDKNGFTIWLGQRIKTDKGEVGYVVGVGRYGGVIYRVKISTPKIRKCLPYSVEIEFEFGHF